MNTVFIISEYNPFHNGHAFHIEKIREELHPDVIVSIMSGNFVQRGAPAVLDKFKRAELAVSGGCDLVVELPCVYATSSAEFFAKGGVFIANALDSDGILSFGSESGDASKIITVSKTLLKEKDRLNIGIREGLDQGYSFPMARAEAFRKLSQNNELTNYLQSPNNTLAVEYVKAALAMDSTLSFHTVTRHGMGYHDTLEEFSSPEHPALRFPSATAMRSELTQGNLDYVLQSMPPQNRDRFQRFAQETLLLSEDHLKDLILYRLNLFPDAIKQIPEARDGLGERIINSKKILNASTLQEFALQVKTRRFTYTRIRRLLLHLALGFDELDYDNRRSQRPEYTRILALNEKGRQFLKETRTTRTIPVVQSAREISADAFKPDLNASLLYSMLNQTYPSDLDFTFKLRLL